MRISDWSSDVCSSDLRQFLVQIARQLFTNDFRDQKRIVVADDLIFRVQRRTVRQALENLAEQRSEEHTSELQSLMRTSYAVSCLKKKKKSSLLHDTLRSLLSLSAIRLLSSPTHLFVSSLHT